MVRYIREVIINLEEIPLEYIKGARLLSTQEFNKYYHEIPGTGDRWWLSSPAEYDGHVWCVGDNTSYTVIQAVDEEAGIRPVLILDSSCVNFNIKDRFKIGNYTFTMISSNLALCDAPIIESIEFNWNYNATDSNKYEKSQVKKYVDYWFNKIRNR